MSIRPGSLPLRADSPSNCHKSRSSDSFERGEGHDARHRSPPAAQGRNAGPRRAGGAGRGAAARRARLHPRCRQRRAGREFGDAVDALRAGERRQRAARISGLADARFRRGSSAAAASPPRRSTIIASSRSSRASPPGRPGITASSMPPGAFSPVGRTRTLPEGPVDRFRIGIFSCANLRFGWFNAYAHAAGARRSRPDPPSRRLSLRICERQLSGARPRRWPAACSSRPERSSLSPTIACATPPIAPIPTCSVSTGASR